jgi:hypothetical protein
LMLQGAASCLPSNPLPHHSLLTASLPLRVRLLPQSAAPSIPRSLEH